MKVRKFFVSCICSLGVAVAMITVGNDGGCLSSATPSSVTQPKSVFLHLTLRRRVEDPKGSGHWKVVITEKGWPAAQTAIVIVDMWDYHWCETYAARTHALALRMDPVISAARANGVQIVHAPAQSLKADEYRRSEFGQRALSVPRATLPNTRNLQSPAMPALNYAFTSCMCKEKHCKVQGGGYPGRTHQGEDPAISWKGNDIYIETGDELYRYCQAKGISHLLYFGGASNICLFERPFGVWLMKNWGMDCIIVRDMVEAFTSSSVSTPEEGDRLVVEFFEKYWAPSTSSADLLEVYPSESAASSARRPKPIKDLPGSQ